jgi:hypothetical protein
LPRSSPGCWRRTRSCARPDYAATARADTRATCGSVSVPGRTTPPPEMPRWLTAACSVRFNPRRG